MPATATAAAALARTSAGTAATTAARTAPASRARSPRGTGSRGRWRSLWRTTPIWVETWKPGTPRAPHTSSVDPPPMSTTSSSVGSPAGRAAVAPANVKAASSAPLRVRPSTPRRARTRSANAPPLAASRTAEVITTALAAHSWAAIAAP